MTVDSSMDVGVRPVARNRERTSVWHCSLHNHPEDRLLSDQQWGQIAVAFLDGAALAPAGDPGAVRWVAVRHGVDHVHLVATLVRQDGPTIWMRHDYRRWDR